VAKGGSGRPGVLGRTLRFDGCRLGSVRLGPLAARTRRLVIVAVVVAVIRLVLLVFVFVFVLVLLGLGLFLAGLLLVL
jgi:hypothetical protein